MARRLLAAETAGQRAAESHAHEAGRVLEKLQGSLTRLAGADGFASLLRRALALASAEVPALRAVALQPDGALAGLESLPTAGADGAPDEAAVAITAHLLGLLATFIGDPMTLRLLREAWPDAAWDG